MESSLEIEEKTSRNMAMLNAAGGAKEPQGFKDHFQGIFCKQDRKQVQDRVHHIWKQLERQCKWHPWEPFTSDELKATMEKWKGSKATGPDGVAREALKAMNQHEPGEHVRSTWAVCRRR